MPETAVETAEGLSTEELAKAHVRRWLARYEEERRARDEELVERTASFTREGKEVPYDTYGVQLAIQTLNLRDTFIAYLEGNALLEDEQLEQFAQHETAAREQEARESQVANPV